MVLNFSIHVFSLCFLMDVMEASNAFLAALSFPSNSFSVWTEEEVLPLREWSDRMRQKPHFPGWLNPVQCQLNLLFSFWTVSPTYCKVRLLQVIQYITFGELQSVYVVFFGTTQSNIFLLDVLITLSLDTKLGLSLQIFDFHLQLDLHDPLPHSLLRLAILLNVLFFIKINLHKKSCMYKIWKQCTLRTCAYQRAKKVSRSATFFKRDSNTGALLLILQNLEQLFYRISIRFFIALIFHLA